MKLFELSKDGGPESTVWGYFLCEFKSLFSIVLLRFEDGSRDAYHNHAFNCISWVFKGQLDEYLHKSTAPDPFDQLKIHRGAFNSLFNFFFDGIWPVITRRSTMHKVVSQGTTWVISFRGPWSKTWNEIVDGQQLTLTSGRKVVDY